MEKKSAMETKREEDRLADLLGLPTTCQVCGAKLDAEDRHRGQCYSHGPKEES